MKNLLDTEGTVLFPFQTEIHFIWTIFSTVKRLVIGTRDHICRSNTGAPVSVFCFLWPMWVSVLRWSGL